MKYIEEFQVRLEGETFLPGDVLRGSVSFILRQPIKAKSLAINFEGEGLAVATQLKNKNCSRQFMHLEEKVAAFNKSQPEVMKAFQTPGKHTFFFFHRLPKNLPGSFSYSAADHDASIAYCIYAVIKAPKRFGCKQMVARAEVTIPKTQSDYDEDFDFEEICADGDCTYTYVPLNELERNSGHKKPERVATQLPSSLSAARFIRSSSQSSTESSSDSVTGSAVSTDNVLNESYDSHMSLGSMGSESSDHSRLSSQSSESDAFDSSRHTSVDDSGLDDNDVQEYIVKVLRATDTGKETSDVTSSVGNMNISSDRVRKTSVIKTVIIM
ncbi:PREDICTED: uncharacterized protein LOC106821392 isoform X2 [Priapulus caudatus]|uniref:Uncharacterized protein LOC106821392 isoform X1 n=1 Tax=Priapulus caudatus TaxID=37621 RepID=A0ABM1FB26_PRICU|nr:PREDICTED: uncharacterized protein LOC106821392 isoform X1 [Priapulus caudatus]XP_014681647.1 PREDICTED: uncharacterized protein LOC106821392 isoform X2 [Priapulus caudatus]